MSNTDIVTAFHAAMRHKSPDELADLYAEDGLHEFPFGGLAPFEGREAIRAGYTAMWGGMRGEVREVRDVVVRQTTDPEVVVVEQTAVAVLDGTEVRVPGLLVLRIQNDAITHTRDYMDTSAIPSRSA